MSQEEAKQINASQWIHIGIFLLGIATCAGFMQAQVGNLEAQIREVKQSYQQALEDNTKEIRSLNNRISRIEGKLEK
jgi:type VI protein secretion system component VasK